MFWDTGLGVRNPWVCIVLPSLTLGLFSKPRLFSAHWGLVPAAHMPSRRAWGKEDVHFGTCALWYLHRSLLCTSLLCTSLFPALSHLSTPPQNIASFTLAQDEAGNVLLEDGKGRCPFDPNFKSTALVVGKWWCRLGAVGVYGVGRYTGQEN